MAVTDPIPPEKDTTWIWIVAIVVVLCLCCSLAAAIGGILYVRQNGLTLPGGAPAQATAIPAPATGPLVIKPFTSTSSQIPTLQNLVLGWQPSVKPGVQTWQAYVAPSQSALLYLGWCAADQSTLNQNNQHLTWSLVVDAKPVDVKSLAASSGTGQQGFCQSYAGEIVTWTQGGHTIKTTMHLDQQINDGWSDYPAGDYVDVYSLTVTP
jgi:hypothetical protein